MKALYLDFDGTLATDRYWRSLPAAQHESVQKLLFGGERTIVRDWMRGKYTAEEVNQYVADTLHLPYDELWEVFVKDCKTIAVPDELLRCIDQLSDRFVRVLITGNMDSFSRFTVPALKLENYFDHISNSFHEGSHKSDDDGRLFVDWAKRINIPLSETILIDDQQKICEIFTKLGGTAFCTTGPGDTLRLLQSI